MKLYRYGTTALILTAMCYLCLEFGRVSACVTSTLTMCYTNLIPALFPFFVLADMLTANIRYNDIPYFIRCAYQKLFNMPQSTLPVFVSGLISGYPVGASQTYDMYDKGYITKNCSERLICYTNNPGPMFVISVIGMGMYRDINSGIVLYIIHIISTLVTGLLTRKRSEEENISVHEIRHTHSLAEIIENSFAKVIKICGFVTAFAILNDGLSLVTGTNTSVIIGCLTEITYGISNLSQHFPYHIAMPISSFALGWSGICVCLQVKSVTRYKLSLKKYVCFKLICGTIASVICCLYVNYNKCKMLELPNCIEWICCITSISLTYIFIFVYMSYKVKNKKQTKRNCML